MYKLCVYVYAHRYVYPREYDDTAEWKMVMGSRLSKAKQSNSGGRGKNGVACRQSMLCRSVTSQEKEVENSKEKKCRQMIKNETTNYKHRTIYPKKESEIE